MWNVFGIEVVGQQVLDSVVIEIDITLVYRIADGSHIESIDSVAHAEDIVTLGAYHRSVGNFQDALSRYVGVIRSC